MATSGGVVRGQLYWLLPPPPTLRLGGKGRGERGGLQEVRFGAIREAGHSQEVSSEENGRRITHQVMPQGEKGGGAHRKWKCGGSAHRK